MPVPRTMRIEHNGPAHTGLVEREPIPAEALTAGEPARRAQGNLQKAAAAVSATVSLDADAAPIRIAKGPS